MMENDKECSEMMEKGEVDGSRTVEGLRGRLLAERLASRAAREEAELMSKRLMELERLLTMEIKARNRAEKRLKRMLKKLDSLKILDVSSQSNVSEGSGSSSACFSGIHRLEEEEEKLNASQNEESTKCCVDGKIKRTQNLSTSEDGGDEASGTMSPGSVNQSVSQEESWVSARTAHSHNNKDPGREENIEFQYSPKSVCSVEAEADDMRVKAIDQTETGGAQQQIDDVDDRLALVHARIWADTEVASEPQKSRDVQDVLVALKHVKMQLQNTMGRTVPLCRARSCMVYK